MEELENQDEFLKELTKLSHKYKIRIAPVIVDGLGGREEAIGLVRSFAKDNWHYCVCPNGALTWMPK